ncbi:MAG: DUF3500 domain-containing protein [Planctomycetota bacterium]
MKALSVAFALLALISSSCVGGAAAGGIDEIVHDVAERGQRLLQSLSTEQRRKAVRAIEDEEAFHWHFVPGRYAGVELGALNRTQRVLAHDLVRAMLGAAGYSKVSGIINLEDVLHDFESTPEKEATHRDPGRYAVLLFGEPDPEGTFVVRFQGHHVSLRLCVVDGILTSHTPHFLGSNPHRVFDLETMQPDESFWAVLGDEELLGCRLLATLDDEQRALAVVSSDAPSDVLLGPKVDVRGGAPAKLEIQRGVALAAMTVAQQELFWQLVELYAHRLRGAHAEAELVRIRAVDAAQLTFAWAGSDQKGQGHYYRIAGPFFAIEYDCTQNDANHVHTVWRDFERDFGGDPLREHLRVGHGR